MTTRLFKLAFLLLFIFIGKGYCQEFPSDVLAALKNDDVITLEKLMTTHNIDSCYGDYSILSNAVRIDAKKCFDFLIEKGANVNISCNGYVPPLMHAAKYGRLEMVKILVAKGADINYKYTGTYIPAKGQTPLTYAESNDQTAIAKYLRSLPQPVPKSISK